MDAHVGLDRSAGMYLIALDAPLLVEEGFVNILLLRGMEQTTGIDRQLFTIGSDVLVERQSGSLGADVPQRYVDRTGQIDREERQVTVDVPQLMPDLLAVVRRTAQYDGSDVVVNVSLGDVTRTGS